MICTVSSFVILFSLFQGSSVETTAIGVSTSAAISLSNPDLVLIRSVLYSPHIKGNVGESHMHTYIAREMKEATGLRHVPVALGRQGIDGIYVKYGVDGTPNSLVVSEAKFGNSQLGITRDGIQLGRVWTSRRLGNIARNYELIASQISRGDIQISKIPQGIQVHRLQIQMPDGKAAVFWKHPSDNKWKFAGSPGMLEGAKTQYQKMASLFSKASVGDIDYQRLLFKNSLKGGLFTALIYEVSDLDLYSLKLTKINSISRQLVGSNFIKVRSVLESSIADELAKKLPQISQSEIRLLASDYVRHQENIEELINAKRQSFAFSTIQDGIRFGIYQALFDVALGGGIEYFITSKVDIERLAYRGVLAFSAGFGGYSAGQYVAKSIIQSRVADRILPNGAVVFGTSAKTLAAKTAASALGGGLAVAVYSYGNFLLGYSSIGEAHRSALIGVSSLGLGAAGGAGIMGAAMAFGTAGSGAAISSLSGAAATNAALAYLGGGTIAAGGGGMAAGLMVVSGGTAIIAIAGGVAAHYTFSYFDELNELEKTSRTVDFIRNTNFYFSRNSVEEHSAIPSIGYWKQVFKHVLEKANE